MVGFLNQGAQSFVATWTKEIDQPNEVMAAIMRRQPKPFCALSPDPAQDSPFRSPPSNARIRPVNGRPDSCRLSVGRNGRFQCLAVAYPGKQYLHG